MKYYIIIHLLLSLGVGLVFTYQLFFKDNHKIHAGEYGEVMLLFAVTFIGWPFALLNYIYKKLVQ